MVASNPELRSQIFRVAADAPSFPSTTVAKAIQSSSVREQYFALLAFKRHGDPLDKDLIVKLIQQNDGKDLYLRHAAIEALTRLDAQTLGGFHSHGSEEMQLPVGLRRIKAPEIHRFLNAESDAVSTEAALGIHDDFSILPALSFLAKALESSSNSSNAFVLRAIHANARMGKSENASRIAKWASDATKSEEQRLFALKRLISGALRPARCRNQALPILAGFRGWGFTISQPLSLLSSITRRIDKSSGIHDALSRAFNLTPSDEMLLQLIKQESADESVRIAALHALADERGSSQIRYSACWTPVQFFKTEVAAMRYAATTDPMPNNGIRLPSV